MEAEALRRRQEEVEVIAAAPIDLTGLRFKTGQRVPMTSWYVDQYGIHTHHEEHRTFPPCIGRRGECAYRSLVASNN